jgi:CHAD domain-containing protein
MPEKCVLAEERALSAIKRRVRTLRECGDVLDNADPETIHDARVASRRMRVALVEYAFAFEPDSGKLFMKRMRDITRGLGRARELDVTLALLGSMREILCETAAETLETLEAMEDRLRSMRVEESESVRSARVGITSDAFDQELRHMFEDQKASAKCFVRRARKRLDTRWRKMFEAWAMWQRHSTDDLLHALRVSCKKMRYALEVYDEWMEGRFGGVLRDLKKVQDELGEWNDARVMLRYLRASRADNRADLARGRELLESHLCALTEHRLAAFTELGRVFFAENRRSHLKGIVPVKSECCAARSSIPGSET